MMPGELSMESIKERLDWLEARVTENEGDADMTGIYWDELRHLRQVYDRMVMDSQGKGIQMMQDLMEKQPETRDNYTVGVPTADSQADAASVPAPAIAAPAASHAEPDGDEGPVVNLTINVNGDKSMELMRSQGDVRVPLNMQVPLEKARKARKEKEASVDGIDQDKIDAAKKKAKPEDEKDETPEAEKSFRRAETETLQKSHLSRQAALPTVSSMCGSWAFKALKKSQSVDDVALAIKTVLQKAGAALVMGMKAPASAEAKKSAYAEIVAINCEIQRLQEQMQESNEPDVNVSLNAKLRVAYEKLSAAIMKSEGLGLTTEDLIVSKPDTRFPEKMTETAVGKSQKDDLEKAQSKHFTGKLPSGAKYAMTVWDADGGLDDEQEKAVIVHVASTDKAVAKRLAAKIPPLPKMKDMRHVIGGSQDAPIDKKHARSAKGKHAHEHKPEGHRAGFGEKKEKSNNGNHYGQIKHVVRHSGKK